MQCDQRYDAGEYFYFVDAVYRLPASTRVDGRQFSPLVLHQQRRLPFCRCCWCNRVKAHSKTSKSALSCSWWLNNVPHV